MKFITVLVLIVSIVLSGCATATEIPPTSTPKPTSCEEVDESCIEVFFKEDECTYHGPTHVAKGIVYIQFHNQREERARMVFLKLVEGRRVQDWQAFVGDEPSNVHHNTHWFEAFEPARPAGPGKMYLREESLLPGSYVIDCFVEDPYLLWYAGGFTVD